MLSLSRSTAATAAAALLLVSEGVVAHMALSKPPPLRSTLNKQYDHSNFDYSMTAPLSLDGSNFPCKGYNTDVPGVSTAVETLKAGSSFTASFAPGGAKHEGGSCQFALSYDGGKSFGVIHSVIGGCPMQESYTFKIPSNVPAGKNILFSWTWFNKVGNREMYQNCAAIDIESSATAPLKVPRIFEANIFGAGTCNTVEQDELVFPNPGESVEYGGIWSGKTPTKADLKITNCPDDKIVGESSFVTLSGSEAAAGGGVGGEGAGSTPSASVSEKTPETAPQTSSQPFTPLVTLSLGRATKSSSAKLATATPSGAPAPSSSPVPSSSKASLALGRNRGSSTGAPSSTNSPSTSPKVSSTPAVPGADAGSSTCSGEGMKCSADGQSFSVCSSGAWVNMGSVAPGTICKDDAIILAPVSTGPSSNVKVSCKPNELKCSTDGTTFSVCNADGTGLTNMGSVAPGTKCTNGSIVLARRTKHKRAPGRGTRRLESTKH